MQTSTARDVVRSAEQLLLDSLPNSSFKNSWMSLYLLNTAPCPSPKRESSTNGNRYGRSVPKHRFGSDWAISSHESLIVSSCRVIIQSRLSGEHATAHVCVHPRIIVEEVVCLHLSSPIFYHRYYDHQSRTKSWKSLRRSSLTRPCHHGFAC